MALSGNKGEWSEIYALFKLLGEGKVHAGAPLQALLARMCMLKQNA